MMKDKRVVITGMGIWSCIGTTLDEVAQSLREGRCGLGNDPSRLEYGYHCDLTGIVPEPDLKPLLHRRLRTGLSQEAAFAYMASRQAFEQAGIDEEYRLAHEIGVIFGNDSSAKAIIETDRALVKRPDTELLGSGLIFQSMNSTVNMNMNSIFRLRGINFSVSAACASGSHAVGLGYLLIRQGLQDMVLCGGAQEVNTFAMSSFDALGAFSKRVGEPLKASRPFDRDRDGLVPSGGAAALVLEDYDHAVRRGATILAEVAGYGFSSNGGGISEPSDDGSVTAMMRALEAADITPADIDYVSAHATGTPQGDRFEAIALDRIFHGHRALISSTKGMTGHECWMSGASELVYSALMMRDGFVARNYNLENPDEDTAKLNIAKDTVEMPVRTVLSNSFGFGGTNSAVVLKSM
ncbi:MAG: beta-ketoacyl-[Bacteroidales bacterium]|nr:beta-ketoacyl-[acyl-carrier-protein] synthase family protein [Bacteroidales bacterium]